MMTYDYSGFKDFEFEPLSKDHVGEVYVLIFKFGDVEIPFYVGQTASFLRRMDDYFWASFAAATDFKVGIAVRFFCEEGDGKVIVRHKRVSDPLAEERAIKDELEKSFELLNGRAYDYRKSDEAAVREAILSTCREIIQAAKRSATDVVTRIKHAD